jgi:hypothetical protein
LVAFLENASPNYPQAINLKYVPKEQREKKSSNEY